MLTSGIWSKYQLACQETPNEQNIGKKNRKGKNSDSELYIGIEITMVCMLKKLNERMEISLKNWNAY